MSNPKAAVTLILLVFLMIHSVNAQVRKVGNADTCNIDLFLKVYYADANYNVWMRDVVRTASNDMIAGGSIVDVANSPDNTDAVLMKINSSGAKVWEKIFSFPGSQIIEQVVLLADGNYMAIGTDLDGANVSFFLLKFDTNGNTIWKRTYQHGPISNNMLFAVTQAKEDVNGAIIVMAYYLEDGLSFSDRVLYMKFDAAGSLLIAKSNKPPGTINFTAGRDFIIKDGYTYIAGMYYSYYNSQGLLIKINNTTGDLQWAKYYGFNNSAASFSQIHLYGNQLCLTGNNSLNANDTNVIILCDTSGKVVSSKYLQYPGWRETGSSAIDKNGNITWFQNNATDLTVSKLHPVNGLASVKLYNQLRAYPRINSVHFAPDSTIYFAGNTIASPDQSQFVAGRMSKTGDIACSPATVAANFGDGISHDTLVNYTTIDKNFTEVFINWDEASPLIKFVDTLCQSPQCTRLKLSAVSAICNTDTLLVYVQKDCYYSPVFDFDRKKLKQLSSTDTLVKFVLLDSGLTVIRGHIETGCNTIEDSISVQIQYSPGKVHLGDDTTICPGNILQLNAHKGYLNYQWQDGSTDSIITAMLPGIYHVVAKDGCGNIYKDTINVFATPAIALSIGPDRTKCNADTLHLNAPAGFLNYAWSNNYNISALTGSVVIVNPTRDTAYYIKAEKTPGCFAFDTVRISVNKSGAINLGPDKSFCMGDSAIFDAGIGFSIYTWSNGQTSQTITAHNTGMYSIIGTSANGCKSYDTVAVLKIFAMPVVSLNHETSLCFGSTKLLDAGTFSQYLWNTGSTNQTIIVTGIGYYFIEVTDNNGCKATDSNHITTILPLPQKFLPVDSAICTYSTITLKPINIYKSYLWSDNSVSTSISLASSGLYWLQVTDQNNCVGKDSIQISQKNCQVGFYIPNAFTPNNDGKNDVYKPLIFGNVKQYAFSIYNRYGQVVFKTTDLQKGWDGKLSGRAQNGNAFIWICDYQFEDNIKRVKKGSVMLVR